MLSDAAYYILLEWIIQKLFLNKCKIKRNVLKNSWPDQLEIKNKILMLIIWSDFSQPPLNVLGLPSFCYFFFFLVYHNNMFALEFIIKKIKNIYLWFQKKRILREILIILWTDFKYWNHFLYLLLLWIHHFSSLILMPSSCVEFIKRDKYFILSVYQHRLTSITSLYFLLHLLVKCSSFII